MNLLVRTVVAIAIAIPGIASGAIGQTLHGLKLIGQFQAHDLKGESLIQVAHSSASTLFITVASDGLVRGWRKPTDQIFEFRQEPSSMLFNVRVDPHNTSLITATYNGVATRWSLNGLAPRHYGPHFSGVTDVEILPKQAGVVTTSDDGSIRFWSNAGKLLRRIERPGVSRHLALARQRQLVAAAQDISAITILSTGGIVLQSFPTNQGRLNDVIFSPNEKLLLTTGFDGTIKIWDLANPYTPPKLKTTIQASTSGWVNGLAINRSGILASVGDDGKVQLWNLQGKNLATLQLSNKHLLSCSFSANGEQLLVAAQDGMVSELRLKP